MSYELTCPNCEFKGDSDKDFNMNMTDECFCPNCDSGFTIDDEDPDDEG